MAPFFISSEKPFDSEARQAHRLSMDAISPNARGAIFMIFSMAGFVFNDMFMKLVADDLSLFQAIFLRGIFAVALLFLIARWRDAFVLPLGFWPTVRNPAFLLRTLGELCATFLFLQALFNMPIANVTAVLQLLPLTITLAAALVLGEAVGWRRYTAIIAGFAGVLLIVKPGTDGFSTYSFYALAAVGFVTLRDLATRKMPNEIPSLFVSFTTAIAVFIAGGLGSLFQPWNSVSSHHVLYLACAASFLGVGYVCAVLTMRSGEVSFVSPFRYSIMIWALLIGYFVFSDIPDGWELLSAAIIVASGLFTFYRERRAIMRPVKPH